MFKVFFFGGIVVGCGYAWHRHQRRKAYDEARRRYEEEEYLRRLQECLDGIWSEPRPLIADIGSVLEGPGETAAISGSGRLVEIPLTPQAQRDAWSAVTFLATEGRTEDRERTIRLVLGETVAPACDWTQGWLPYQADPRFRDVYESVGILLDLAELSGKYGQASAQLQQNPQGAMLSPGWVHEKPAPTVDIRPGDFVEVLVDEYSPDPGAESRSADWAWVLVESAPPQHSAVAGTLMLEAPPGQYPHLLRHSDMHGFVPGTRVVVPRASIFRVIKGR